MTSRKSKTKKAEKVQPKKMGTISWFEIPAFEFDRAVSFYQQLFDVNFEISESPTHRMAFFPEVSPGIGGAIVAGEGSIPSQTGSLIYFDCGDDLSLTIEKAQLNGGYVLMGKTLINTDVGYYALLLDTEGNRFALHSRS